MHFVDSNRVPVQPTAPIAFDELFEAYHATVVNVAFRVTLHRDDAQDIAQIVFMRAFQSIGSFSSDESLRGWLSKVTRNCAIDALRRRANSQRERLVEMHGRTSPGPEHASLQRADDDDLHAALSLLPTKYRAPLDLFYFRELSLNEISAHLDLPLNTIKTHMSRGKRRLKAELEALGGRAA